MITKFEIIASDVEAPGMLDTDADFKFGDTVRYNNSNRNVITTVTSVLWELDDSDGEVYRVVVLEETGAKK